MQQENFNTNNTPRIDTVTSSRNEGFAEVKIERSTVKWVVVFAVLLLIVFLALLLCSVLIGVTITRDMEVKNGELVSTKDRSSVIKTSTKLYTYTVNLDTPLEVVKNVKTISIKISTGTPTGSTQQQTTQQTGIFKFNVIGFDRVTGRKLIFFGHTHSAEIMADGSVQISQTVSSNSKRGFNFKRGEYATVDSLVAAEPSLIYNPINSCNDLSNLNPSGTYRLNSNLSCSLDAPLPIFSGVLNGNGYTISIFMDRCDDVALFQQLNGASVFNLNIGGKLNGCGRCSALAVEALPGTVLLSNLAFASISCNQGNSAYPILASCFVSRVTSPEQSSISVTFESCFSGCTVDVNPSNNSYQGGFFAISDPTVNVISRYNQFFSIFNDLPSPSRFSVIGVSLSASGKKRNWCNNPNDPMYNAYCWQNFQFSDSTGTANPTQTYYNCCSGFCYCSACYYDPDPAGCYFDLGCGRGQKKDQTQKRSVPSDVIAQYAKIPFVQNC